MGCVNSSKQMLQVKDVNIIPSFYNKQLHKVWDFEYKDTLVCLTEIPV